MFFSLNRKILYSLFAFIILIAGIFFAIFTNLYSQKLQDNQNLIYMRNQYVVDLLNDNIRTKKQLARIFEEFPEVSEYHQYQNVTDEVSSIQDRLEREKNLNEELKRNYNNNRETIITGTKIIGFCFFVVVLLVLFLMFLLNHWVITPLQKMTEISRKVSLGIFSSRLETSEPSQFLDEFDILFSAFNNMLDNTEYNIETIKNREQFLQQLIDAIPDGIRVIDKDYNVVMANKAFYSILKLKNTCIGEKCYRAYGYDCAGCLQTKYTCPLQYLKQNKNQNLHTIHEVDKVPFYLNAARLRWGVGDDNYYTVETMHDLRNDVHFSHQQKISSLAFLSTSIAHEMKNNLGAIRLILEGMLDTEYKNVPSDDNNKKYLTMIYNQLIEAIKTPERLLRLAQYSENDDGEIDVGSAIMDMTLMVDYDAKRQGINIETNIDGDFKIIGNEADFKMIILNLAQNAIKAMVSGGVLSISCRSSSRDIQIEVADTGIGIEAEHIKHIFEPFYSANKRKRSSGLGLAIVFSLVEKMRGRISVSSIPQQGTTFTLKFPKPKKKKTAKKD